MLIEIEIQYFYPKIKDSFWIHLLLFRKKKNKNTETIIKRVNVNSHFVRVLIPLAT